MKLISVVDAGAGMLDIFTEGKTVTIDADNVTEWLNEDRDGKELIVILWGEVCAQFRNDTPDYQLKVVNLQTALSRLYKNRVMLKYSDVHRLLELTSPISSAESLHEAYVKLGDLETLIRLLVFASKSKTVGFDRGLESFLPMKGKLTPADLMRSTRLKYKITEERDRL